MLCYVMLCYVMLCYVRDKDIKGEEVAPNDVLSVQGVKRDLPADNRLLRCQSES